LADKFGSQITFASVKGEYDMPQAAPGQLDPATLTDFYRFRTIDDKTRVFGITGHPLKATFSPAFFNAVFNLEKTNAVYVPFPSISAVSFIRFAHDLGLSGASVTIPHKEAIVSFLAEKSPTVRSTGACNTIVRNEDGSWKGFNTDMQGFSDSLLHFIGKKNFSGKKISVIGAGGVARAIAAEIFHLKGKALVLNRTPLRARDLAESFGFRWGGLDTAGIALIDAYNDIIIQTTSVGMEPNANADPLELYKFSGKEVVMDVIYKPAETALLRRASRAGCRTLNGYDMFVRQAQAQYKLFMGKEFPADLMSRIEL
jgi:3-dehydroquinate dehydratase/shikimate dehydrogenase